MSQSVCSRRSTRSQYSTRSGRSRTRSKNTRSRSRSKSLARDFDELDSVVAALIRQDPERHANDAASVAASTVSFSSRHNRMSSAGSVVSGRSTVSIQSQREIRDAEITRTVLRQAKTKNRSKTTRQSQHQNSASLNNRDDDCASVMSNFTTHDILGDLIDKEQKDWDDFQRDWNDCQSVRSKRSTRSSRSRSKSVGRGNTSSSRRSRSQSRSRRTDGGRLDDSSFNGPLKSRSKSVSRKMPTSIIVDFDADFDSMSVSSKQSSIATSTRKDLSYAPRGKSGESSRTTSKSKLMKPVLLSPDLKNSAQNEKETEKLYNAFMRNLSKEERAAHDNTILSNASNLRAALSTKVMSHKVTDKEHDFENFNFDSFATDTFDSSSVKTTKKSNAKRDMDRKTDSDSFPTDFFSLPSMKTSKAKNTRKSRPCKTQKEQETFHSDNNSLQFSAFAPDEINFEADFSSQTFDHVSNDWATSQDRDSFHTPSKGFQSVSTVPRYTFGDDYEQQKPTSKQLKKKLLNSPPSKAVDILAPARRKKIIPKTSMKSFVPVIATPLKSNKHSSNTKSKSGWSESSPTGVTDFETSANTKWLEGSNWDWEEPKWV